MDLKDMRIGVVGNGVVGGATGRAYRPYVRDVLWYDVDPARSTATLDEVLRCDVVFVCLPTPQKKDGIGLDTSYVYDFFSLPAVRESKASFALRSTVPVGTTRRLAQEGLTVVHYPEFLTARTADTDAARPKRVLIGEVSGDERSSFIAEDLVSINTIIAQRTRYGPRESPPVIMKMTSDETEFTKLLQNSFSAVKVAFFNEAYQIAEAKGLDWETVMTALLAGGWVNPMHTQVPGPDGFGFSGSCLPKDLSEFVTMAIDTSLLGDGANPVSRAAYYRNIFDRQRPTK